MNEQITMAGFEKPSAKEYAFYEAILPQLQATVDSMGADIAQIKFRAGDEKTSTYSSVFYQNILSFRLRIRTGTPYIEVHNSSKDTVFGLFDPGQQKQNGDYWRVRLLNNQIVECAETLCKVMRDTINRLPKEWDCCSRYIECSDAKQCVHPNPSMALACGYRKILLSGKIYYGVNRNIE